MTRRRREKPTVPAPAPTMAELAAEAHARLNPTGEPYRLGEGEKASAAFAPRLCGPTPPGCARHWEERNRELVRENEVLRSNSDHLSSENASLARQVEAMAMRIESLAEELAKPEDARLREVLGWQTSYRQWRPTTTDTAFAPPFGTIRQCRGCGCLVAGGPTACVRCAEAGA